MAEESNVEAPPATEAPGLRTFLLRLLAANVGLVVLAWIVMIATRDSGIVIMLVAVGCVLQFFAGIFGLFEAGARGVGLVSTVTAPILAFLGLITGLHGMGWGRPLRVRGRQVYPQLRSGADWTDGERPSPAGLDMPTRRALEALWLHDAQKEHASVPAFARIGWLLAAVGAPAQLMAWSQRAALEEVEHARRCFALAAGYGGRTHSVEAMPDLLLSGLDVRGEDPFALLARESLQDGCQLEDFNADVAAACAAVCEEPVTRAVQEQIAREERSHAEFSWALLAWTLERSPAVVLPAIEAARKGLDDMVRPRAVGPDLWALVARADASQLLRHGRVPDETLRHLWDARLAATRTRLATLVASAAEWRAESTASA